MSAQYLPDVNAQGEEDRRKEKSRARKVKYQPREVWLLTGDQLRRGIPPSTGGVAMFITETDFVHWRLQQHNHHKTMSLPAHVRVLGFSHGGALAQLDAWAGNPEQRAKLVAGWNRVLRDSGAFERVDTSVPEAPDAKALLNLLLAIYLANQPGFSSVKVLAEGDEHVRVERLLASVTRPNSHRPLIGRNVALADTVRGNPCAATVETVRLPTVHPHRDDEAVWDTCGGVQLDPRGALTRVVTPTTRFELSKHAIWNDQPELFLVSFYQVFTALHGQEGGFRADNTPVEVARYLLRSGWQHDHHGVGDDYKSLGALDNFVIAHCVAHCASSQLTAPYRRVETNDGDLLAVLGRYGVARAVICAA